MVTEFPISQRVVPGWKCLDQVAFTNLSLYDCPSTTKVLEGGSMIPRAGKPRNSRSIAMLKAVYCCHCGISPVALIFLLLEWGEGRYNSLHYHLPPVFPWVALEIAFASRAESD